MSGPNGSWYQEVPLNLVQAALEALKNLRELVSGIHQSTLADQGLVVLGFPCDQFGHQEPGDENEIKNFCSLTYDVSFPMYAKIEVNGANAHPLYKHLKEEAPGVLGSEGIKWNFTKFLIGKDGKVVKRYGSMDTPEKIDGDIAKLL